MAEPVRAAAGPGSPSAATGFSDGVDRTWIRFDGEDPAVEDFRATVRRVLGQWHEGADNAWEEEGSVPAALFRALGQAGCFRDRWRPGRNAGMKYGVALAQELSLVASGAGLAASLHSEVFLGILHPLARTPWLCEVREAALDGRVIGCFAATEASAGSDLDGLRTTAVDANGSWRLVGQKRFTSNLRTATHAVVLARPLDEAGRPGPVAAFLVPLANSGVHVEGQYRTLGVRSCSTGQLRLDTVVPFDALLGGRRSSLMYVKRALDGERILAAAQAVAGSRLALRIATAFLRRRGVQGHRLFELSVHRQRLGEAASQLWAGEALLASVLDQMAAGREVARQAAALKLFTADMARHVTDVALQSMGGRGYLEDFLVERLWRDARLLRIGGGADEVMGEIVAAGLDRDDGAIDQWLSRREDGDWARQEDGYDDAY